MYPTSGRFVYLYAPNQQNESRIEFLGNQWTIQTGVAKDDICTSVHLGQAAADGKRLTAWAEDWAGVLDDQFFFGCTLHVIALRTDHRIGHSLNPLAAATLGQLWGEEWNTWVTYGVDLNPLINGGQWPKK